jgi:hypothetical protein
MGCTRPSSKRKSQDAASSRVTAYREAPAYHMFCVALCLLR